MIKATLPIKSDLGVQEFEVEILTISQDFLGRKYASVRALPIDRKIVYPFTLTDYSGDYPSTHTTVLVDCLKNLVNISLPLVEA